MFGRVYLPLPLTCAPQEGNKTVSLRTRFYRPFGNSVNLSVYWTLNPSQAGKE